MARKPGRPPMLWSTDPDSAAEAADRLWLELVRRVTGKDSSNRMGQGGGPARPPTIGQPGPLTHDGPARPDQGIRVHPGPAAGRLFHHIAIRQRLAPGHSGTLVVVSRAGLRLADDVSIFVRSTPTRAARMASSVMLGSVLASPTAPRAHTRPRCLDISRNAVSKPERGSDSNVSGAWGRRAGAIRRRRSAIAERQGIGGQGEIVSHGGNRVRGRLCYGQRWCWTFCFLRVPAPGLPWGFIPGQAVFSRIAGRRRTRKRDRRAKLQVNSAVINSIPRRPPTARQISVSRRDTREIL